MSAFKKIKKSPIEEEFGQYRVLLPQIDQYFQYYHQVPDHELQTAAAGLRAAATDHQDLALLLPDAYGLVKEACFRQFGLLAYDEQLIAAIALHHGNMLEMQTGEGKTLTALFPAFLNGLLGKGVHILTFNDYLARRDADWSRPLFTRLGLSSDCIQQGMPLDEKRHAYRADITYATAKEAGFDYLYSAMAYAPEELVQRPFFFAIVDEADALMIDEARNPLVLAGRMDPTEVDAKAMADLAAGLEQGADFELNDYARNIFLTESGIRKLEMQLEVENLMADEHHALLTALNLALHARMLLKRDIDYVVKNGAILQVDEFTGRVVPDRKWRNGLQTAVEAKEGLPVRSEGTILNAISLQHFLYTYPKLAGMTATARAAAEEFENFYKLRTVIVPPHLPDRRQDEPDLVFADLAAKNRAIVEEVKRVHHRGQPILIGTLNVKESEQLANLLSAAGVKCEVLNAKEDAREAAIVARAARPGQVTISTNMAGRGTDITLGGGDQAEREQVISLGGLYILGTNRHESSRIDRQLRGRAGRQGDPGQTRFFISLQDELMVKYRLQEALPKKYRQLSGPEPITEPKVLKFIDHIQRVIEGQTYDMRRNLLHYSELVEKQRLIIQSERREILLDDNCLLERIGWEGTEPPENTLLDGLRRLALGLYDRYWSDHLDQLQQLKEGIYLVRFGGQKPLREYQRQSDRWFRELCERIDTDLVRKAALLIEDPELDLRTLGVQKPASTWTYLINDNPFGNQLAIMLLDNSNLGFQADPISAVFLFIAGLLQRRKKR
ncbi:accessory Sec system translocase SecA2 [Flavilitoribacter nigricans]|uniref:Protein translocase subunit SecA n=1 Tax=Flavilitoribacter nigricans (strain ATCC 23147 / DSM 23189 / NBRC 102662 / NCIMB 1420 / SS-2) TaxID=1122177 RepID=A0A2D0NBI7_FLAN2|nr:accessory Sec system translocase SecA2 [Flavilitoribacter nigricans]PHN05539.1 accessory Sec system translocase SecA2 [Flavilitoribacter nigricans DSM 23189 = NBRC 102662]